jgi:hypothetical protein
MIDFKNKGLIFKLKQDASYARKVTELLVEEEEIIDSYKAMRDGVIFTNKRIIALNVQGMTGSKKDFTSIPYSKIQTYSVETSGTFDMDSELEIYISSIGRIKFEFKANSKIIEISKIISRAIF